MERTGYWDVLWQQKGVKDMGRKKWIKILSLFLAAVLAFSPVCTQPVYADNLENHADNLENQLDISEPYIDTMVLDGINEEGNQDRVIINQDGIDCNEAEGENKDLEEASGTGVDITSEVPDAKDAGETEVPDAEDAGETEVPDTEDAGETEVPDAGDADITEVPIEEYSVLEESLDIPKYYTLVPQEELKEPYGLDMAGAVSASEDGRNESWVTPVKNQQGYGLCWAFAAAGAIESNLLKEGIISDKTSSEADLSEIYMAWFAKRPNQEGGPGDGTNIADPIDGGNVSQIATILQSGVGLQYEKDYPYVSSWSDDKNLLISTSRIDDGDYKKSDMALLSSCVDYGNIDSKDSAQRQVIQECLLQDGAVSCSYFADQTVASQNPGAAGMISYYSGMTGKTNHAVCIVGWDDAYSKDNFNIKPAGDGAWLIKNSWGTGWSDGGFFWMSYYEGTLCNFQSLQFTRAKDELADVYDCSGAGYQGSMKYGGTSIYGAVVYDVKNSGSADYLTSVGTEFVASTKEVEISIYTSDKEMATPIDGVCKGTYTAKADYPGFYNVTISPLSLEGCKQFSVVIKYADGSLPYEKKASDNTSSGRSYYGYSIEKLNNITETSNDSAADVCIKAYTSYPSSLIPNYEGLQKVYDEAVAFVKEKNDNKANNYDSSRWAEFKNAIAEAEELLDEDKRVTDSNPEIYWKVRKLTEKLEEMTKSFKDSLVVCGGENGAIYLDLGKSQRADEGVLAWANGGRVKENNVVVNKKVKTVYTDITASDISYKNKKGKDKKKKGRVVAGVTSTAEKPQLTAENKIVDSSASQIASVKLKNGKINITAKKAGTVYLWVMDTGDKKAYAYMRVVVKAAAVKVKAVDNDKKQVKSLEIPLASSRTVYVEGYQDKGGTAALDATYSVSVPSKVKDKVSIASDETGSIVNIKGAALNNGKKTKVKVMFSSRQNKKRTSCIVILTNPVNDYKFEADSGVSALTEENAGTKNGVLTVKLKAPTSKAGITASLKVSEITMGGSEKTTDRTIIRAMGSETGYGYSDKGKLQIKTRASGNAKKITSKLKNGTISFNVKKGTPAGTVGYFILSSNSGAGNRVVKVVLE